MSEQVTEQVTLTFDRRAVIVNGEQALQDMEVLATHFPGLLVFNAPRPLPGDETYTGPFAVGRFYALVRPDSPDRATLIRENFQLDATVIRFVTPEGAQDELREYYRSQPHLAPYLAAYERNPAMWDQAWLGTWWEKRAWDKVEVTL